MGDGEGTTPHHQHQLQPLASPIPGVLNSQTQVPGQAQIQIQPQQLQQFEPHPPHPRRDPSDEETLSPVPSSSSVHIPNASNKKRRTTASSSSSSRGVANLTPDQLAKKRANDREAQRAIRERTKNQIENLERRIRELTSQEPYLELQNVLREKEKVEAENVDIRKRLEAVMGLIQPVLGGGRGGYGNEGSTYTLQQPYVRLPRSGLASNINTSTTSSGVSPGAVPTLASPWQTPSNISNGPDSRYIAPQHGQYPQNLPNQRYNKQRQEITHTHEMSPEKLGLDFVLDSSHRATKIPNGINGTSYSPNSCPHLRPHTHTNTQTNHHSHSQSQSQPQAPQHTSGRSSPSQQRNTSTSTPNHHHHNNHPFSPLPTTPLRGFSAPIRNSSPTCPLDSLLLDFLSERHHLLATGMPLSTIIGPAYPSLTPLLYPSTMQTSHPLSKVFTDILATFPDLSTLPEKIAVLYIMFLLMRWQIAPNRENYERLPEWIRPNVCQVVQEHAAWVDFVPWPGMRDRLIMGGARSGGGNGDGERKEGEGGEVLFDDFFIPLTTTLSVNWPHDPSETVLVSPSSTSPRSHSSLSTPNPLTGTLHTTATSTTNAVQNTSTSTSSATTKTAIQRVQSSGEAAIEIELCINPAFERHFRKVENWTLGPAFASAFPGLGGTYGFKE